MDIKLIAVYDDLYMFTTTETNPDDIKSKCVVYNKTRDEYTDGISMGSWIARMGPWMFPNEEQIKEAESFKPQEI